MRLSILLLICLLPLLLLAVDLDDPQDYLEAYLRVRSDTSGAESVYHWTGKVYSYIPGEKRMELFDLEGYNINRLACENDSCYILLAKEVLLFKDGVTGEILETWRNPFTGRVIPVIHIFNDPVNQKLDFGEVYLPYIHRILPSTRLDESLVFHQELFPLSDSPLNTREHGEFVRYDFYQTADITQYEASLAELMDPDKTSVNAKLFRTQITPWLPFMRMGDRAGQLIFVTQGKKLPGGFEGLPENIQDYILERKPAFASAPSHYSEPNENSWTYFKKLYDQAAPERKEP